MEQGLSSNRTFCLQQDSNGFMWIGTLSGLNRYDGNSVNIFMPELKQGTITRSVIFAIYEDSKNRLWIGTDGGGLNRYIKEKNCYCPLANISYTNILCNPYYMIKVIKNLF